MIGISTQPLPLTARAVSTQFACYEKLLACVLDAGVGRERRPRSVHGIPEGQEFPDREWPGRNYPAGDGSWRLDVAGRLHAGASQRWHSTLNQSTHYGTDWRIGLRQVLPTLAAEFHQPRGH